MRFHLPAIPGRSIDKSNSSCAYSQKTRKYVRMMEARGHECFVYEVEGEPLDFIPELWGAANEIQADQINENAQEGDFLCLIAGLCQQSIAEAVALPAVEYGIGYGGTFAPYRVFESYAWMHAIYGDEGGARMHSAKGKFFDTVIPNYFEVEDFPEHDSDRDYLLYIGRMMENKGVQIAEETAKRLGMQLILAGEGEYIPQYGTAIGSVGPDERGVLMAGARAVLAPTIYLEPFGGVAVEAMMCGTPAITTDFGAFTETVQHGITGFRCHTLGEFVEAVARAPELSHTAIRDYAVKNYSLEAVGPRYDQYFTRLQALRGADAEGWYSMNSEGLSVGN